MSLGEARGKDIWDHGGLGERCGARARGHCVGGVDLEALLGGWGVGSGEPGLAEEEASAEPGGREGLGCAAQGA